MRTKSGLPKLKPLRAMPRYKFGFRDNPVTEPYRHSQVGGVQPIGQEVRVLSLFCGCGGLDLGFLGGFTYRGELFPSLPFRIIAAYDNDHKAVETYRLNVAPEVHELDLTTIDMRALPPADMLIGGFPCQDFSSSGPKLGLEGRRGRLYRVLVEYMAVQRPKVVVAENVPHLAQMRGGDVLSTILADFEEVGYDFKVWNLFCPDFGLPQNRSRLFLIGIRHDLPGDPIPPKPRFLGCHRPIEWAIDDLKGVTDEAIANQSQYFVATKATAGAGQGDEKNQRGAISYCVRANPKARVHFHYELERRLTVRECARLQSFPDEFVFPHATGTNMMQIGNAVPPIVAHEVAQSLATYLSSLRDGLVGNRQPRQPRLVQLPLLASGD
jgi:DNA (cytosine-5)-methyltransferase 1